MQEQKAATLELSCTRMLLLLVNHTLVQKQNIQGLDKAHFVV